MCCQRKVPVTKFKKILVNFTNIWNLSGNGFFQIKEYILDIIFVCAMVGFSWLHRSFYCQRTTYVLMNFLITDCDVFFIFNYVIWAGIVLRGHIAHVRSMSFFPLQLLDDINDANNHLNVMYVLLLL